MSSIALVNFYPSTDEHNRLGYNHGLGIISALLKSDGHTTQLFHIFDESAEQEAELQAFSPSAIFVYLTTNQYPLFKKVLIKKWRQHGIPIVVGGPHASCCPKSLAELEGISAVCIGDGEPCILELVRRIDAGKSFDDIPNICFYKNGELIKNVTGYFEDNLDSLPFADRDIFPYAQMQHDRSMKLLGFEFLTSRGCVYHCQYCINPLLRKLHGKKYVRRRSVSNVIKEIQTVVQKFEYTGIIGFVDDIFTLDPVWLKEFAADYRSSIGLPFWCNTHFGNLGEEIIKDLRRAGCARIYVGVECGNEQLRRSVLGKQISNEEILAETARLKKHHLKIVPFFMIGIPGEEEQHIIESIELCRSMAPEWVLLSTFCPYPGTRVFDNLVEQGSLSSDFFHTLKTDTFYSPTQIFKQSRLPQARLEYYFNNFKKLAGF